MKPFVVKPLCCLRAKFIFPGDKSIAHRCLILSSLSTGITRINNFPANNDCLATLSALRKLGVRIIYKPVTNAAGCFSVTVYGRGLNGLEKKYKGNISVGDSGTTLRLLLGVLAGQFFSTKLIAGNSLSKRPMRRVTKPLRLMGAAISSKLIVRSSKTEEYPPITIKGGSLHGITYKMPVASAQVKSAILLAGLYAKGKTKVIETIPTRDHTERILKLFKAKIRISEREIVVANTPSLVSPKYIYIPGDISSAAFFMVMGAIIKNSRILIKKASLNPTRTGILKVLRRMGAKLTITPLPGSPFTRNEPAGNIAIRSSSLKATVVSRDEIPSLIDELPILMVAASLAEGRTIFEGVGELRVKETDRIKSMSENLRKMGVSVKVIKSGKSENIIIRGVKELKAARVKSFGDHRTAMSMVIAGFAATGTTYIDDISCINKSFPGFTGVLKRLSIKYL